MPNEKAAQRDRLILEYGILLSPLEELAKHDAPPTDMELRTAIAKIRGGDGPWREKSLQLATFARDLVFADEGKHIARVPGQVCGLITNGMVGDYDPSQRHTVVQSSVEWGRSQLFTHLALLPIQWEPELFEANTPFTSYLRIKETLAIVKARFDYFDRYLKPDFFHLFLRYVPRDVPVTLVTTAGQTGHNAYGVADVSPVSNLARQEFKDYKLVQVDPADVHDRNLRVDDLIFTLGPGTARAGIALTNFGLGDSSPAAHTKLDAVIAKGTVIHQS